MPRGKVIKRSLDEQIRMLEEDIRIAQNKLNKLQAKWKELQKQKREEDMEDLYALVKESGVSIEDLKHMLTEGRNASVPNEEEAEKYIDIA